MSTDIPEKLVKHLRSDTQGELGTSNMSTDIPEKLVKHLRSEYPHLGGKGDTTGQIRNNWIVIQTITKTALVRVDTTGYLGRHPRSE